MLSLDCRCYFRQEQKMSLRQVMMVRCLIVYLDRSMVTVPIRPEVSTRRAKKTGYEFIEVELEEARSNSALAAMYAAAGKFPKELKDIVYFAL